MDLTFTFSCRLPFPTPGPTEVKEKVGPEPDKELSLPNPIPFQDNEDVHGPREQEKGLVLLHSFHCPPGYCLWLQWREEVGKSEGRKILVSPGEVDPSDGHLGEWLMFLRALSWFFCVRNFRLWDSLSVHAC